MNYYQEENYKIKKPRDLSLSEIKPQDISNIEAAGAKLNNIVGAQYGIIKKTYTEKTGTTGDKGRTVHYYADVLFLEEKSYIVPVTNQPI